MFTHPLGIMCNPNTHYQQQPPVLLAHSFDGPAGETNNVIPDFGKEGVYMNYVKLDGNGFAIAPSVGCITINGLGTIPAGYARRFTFWAKANLGAHTTSGYYWISWRTNLPVPYEGKYWDWRLYNAATNQLNVNGGYYNGSTWDWDGGGWNSPVGVAGEVGDGILMGQVETRPGEDWSYGKYSFRPKRPNKFASYISSTGEHNDGANWESGQQARIQWHNDPSVESNNKVYIRSVLIEDFLE